MLMKVVDTLISYLAQKSIVVPITLRLHMDYIALQEQALQDSDFVERHLYPNIGFYSGTIYQALGIPDKLGCYSHQLH